MMNHKNKLNTLYPSFLFQQILDGSLLPSLSCIPNSLIILPVYLRFPLVFPDSTRVSVLASEYTSPGLHSGKDNHNIGLEACKYLMEITIKAISRNLLDMNRNSATDPLTIPQTGDAYIQLIFWLLVTTISRNCSHCPEHLQMMPQARGQFI
jgi:hypothetical protein